MSDKPKAAPSQEPVAWLFQHEETGVTDCVDHQQVEWGFEKNNPRFKKIAPLYRMPPDAAAQIAGLNEIIKVVNRENAAASLQIAQLQAKNAQLQAAARLALEALTVYSDARLSTQGQESITALRDALGEK